MTDGRTMLGERVVVEFAKSDGPRERRSYRDDDRRMDDRNPRPLRYERPRHTGHRAFVEGLSNSANWQVRTSNLLSWLESALRHAHGRTLSAT